MYERFEQLLSKKELKTSDICKATGLSSTFFSEWKKGKSKSPSSENLLKIAQYLDVSMEYLMTGKERSVGSFSEQADLLIKIRNDKKLLKAIEKFYGLQNEKQEHVIQLIDFLSEVSV